MKERIAMENIDELGEYIKNLCNTSGLHLDKNGPNSFRINTHDVSGITLFMDVKSVNDFLFYYTIRTYNYNGDRSDVHVVFSLMFATFLKTFDGVSCSLFDIPHPVVDDEIWGRYIVPEQTPTLLETKDLSQLKKAIAKIISGLIMWQQIFWSYASCPCEECIAQRVDNTDVDDWQLPDDVQKIMDRLTATNASINYNRRNGPIWSYFYNMSKEITVIKSPELVEYLSKLLVFKDYERREIKGINGNFIIDDDVKSFLTNKALRELKRIIGMITPGIKLNSNEIILLENMVITYTGDYILALGRIAGLYTYKLEKELLRNRHNEEAEFLFPISVFEWQNECCPDQFELLIKSLLEREPGVISVRRAGPLNQGDKGRDLAIQWSIPNGNIASETEPPFITIDVVGQCKASNKTVGKNKVLDIRDTIETHQSSGFFLAVTQQITVSLTEKLEQLKASGIWTQWWNREDIEKRLSKNQDLIPLFPKVIKSKQQVKFVEKD